MSKTDLTPIRDRLESLKQAQSQSAEATAPLWDAPRSPELPHTPAAGSATHPAQIAATVQVLRQRSQQVGAPFPPEDSAPPPSVNEPPSLPPEVSLHWQRLQQEAFTINDLARKQAIALQNFKRSADRLAWSLRKQPPEYGLTIHQFCELQDVVIAQVAEDGQGKLTLTQATVDLFEDERYASQMAQELRAYSQSRSRRPHRNPDEGLSGLLSDPMLALENCWLMLTHTLEARSRLTPLDIVIWMGGGLIGRLALELALAAVPGLFPWLVGATIGAVVLALYRLLLAPRPDVAFVTRLFLALLGLAIGGQF